MVVAAAVAEVMAVVGSSVKDDLGMGEVLGLEEEEEEEVMGLD